MREDSTPLIQPDDMLSIVFGRAVPEGYVVVGASESLHEMIVCREGSIPHKMKMTVPDFCRAPKADKGPSASCPV